MTEITASDLETAIGADIDTATRLLEAVKATVDGYASEAPQTLKNEAMIRMAGWLFQQPPGVMQQSGAGSEITYRGGTSAFRNSGAMALLSPFRRRRARAIG